MMHTSQLPTVHASMLAQFTLACETMLEAHVRRLWRSFDAMAEGGGRLFMLGQMDLRSQNSLTGYWVAVLTDDQQALQNNIRNILMRYAGQRSE